MARRIWGRAAAKQTAVVQEQQPSCDATHTPATPPPAYHDAGPLLLETVLVHVGLELTTPPLPVHLASLSPSLSNDCWSPRAHAPPSIPIASSLGLTFVGLGQITRFPTLSASSPLAFMRSSPPPPLFPQAARSPSCRHALEPPLPLGRSFPLLPSCAQSPPSTPLSPHLT